MARGIIGRGDMPVSGCWNAAVDPGASRNAASFLGQRRERALVGSQNGQFSGELADYQRIGGGPANYDGRELQWAHGGTGMSHVVVSAGAR